MRKLKESKETQQTSVIITTPHAVERDYNQILEEGACYCLLKPFTTSTIANVLREFFENTLEPDHFQPEALTYLQDDKYQPCQEAWNSYIHFWGTRGSVPVSGVDYSRYGGNTSCLEVRNGEDLIIIDAGTGIRELGEQVKKEGIKNIHLFIGHTHWDHIIGFPFFAPVYDPECTIHIYSARGYNRTSHELFTGMLELDFFPVRFDEMQANFQFHDLSNFEPVCIGNLHIHYGTASHPGNTLFFKIEGNKSSIGYATDNEFLTGYQGHPDRIDRYHPLLEPYEDVIQFFSGCDIFIHEAQYTPEEYQKKLGWGHSSIPNAAILAKHCKAPRWIITHHDPSNNDKKIAANLDLQREILAESGISVNSFMAYDGLKVRI